MVILGFVLICQEFGLKDELLVKSPVYSVKALAVKDKRVYALDLKEAAVVKMDMGGNLLAFVQGKGEGPG